MLREHHEIQSGDTLYISAVQHGLHGGSKKVIPDPEPSVEGSDHSVQQATELQDLTSEKLFEKKWREHNLFAKAIDTDEKKAKLKEKLSEKDEYTI